MLKQIHNVFIAGPFAHRKDMPQIAAQFEEKGYSITHKWWETEDLPDAERTPDFLEKMARLDLIGVYKADVLILINSLMSEGKSVEQGIAIALGRTIVGVGKLGEHGSNVYHYMKDSYVWVDDVNTAVQVLEAANEREYDAYWAEDD